MIKKIMKILSRSIFGIVIGIILTLSVVGTATSIPASQVTYTNNNQSTLDKALNDLFDKANKPGDIYIETNNALKKCIRATQLHYTFCQGYSCQYAGISYNAKIQFGKISTSGLNAGDAFDCDVNNDKIYDPFGERFYYVTDLSSNTNYAVLIFAHNTINGFINDYDRLQYSSTSNAYTSGPDVARNNLPTTTQWKNVSLTNTTRDITDETGTVRKSGFSYDGYAARLLTYQELKSGCPTASLTDGSLENCTWLMENTGFQSNVLMYSYWLESVSSTSSGNSWFIRYMQRRLGTDTSYWDQAGVRPAIEVSKSDISY